MLAVYRVGVEIPTPGINGDALAAFFEKNGGTLFGMFNMFSGGALENFSIFALGIMPYISASIIIQLLTVVVPQLETLKKEGESGHRKITQYTRYGTVILSVVQGLFIAVGLEGMSGPGGEAIVLDSGLQFKLMTMLTLTSGTAFIMWLGEQMTERGIGNGISLIIFAGIVARGPAAIVNSIQLIKAGEITIFFVPFLLLFMFIVMALVVFFETSQRRIPIQYAKRVVGKRVYGGQSTHLPLKINVSGVIPPIFASSIMMFPGTIGQFVQVEWVQQVSSMMSPGHALYYIMYIIMIVFFCFFYTAVTFKPDDVAENLKKNGGFIPGIRPGKKTAEFIDKVLTRITVVGAIYLSTICVLPTVLISKFNIPFYFGGTALLIVVGVAIDTIAQIESHLVMRNYEGFMKQGRIRGRK
jgi:preprotein translocase subunit SecY